MRASGIVLMVLGLLAIAFGFNANVAVEAPGLVMTDPLLQSGRVANSDLISQRESIILVGCASFLSGVILTAARAILDALQRPRTPATAD